MTLAYKRRAFFVLFFPMAHIQIRISDEEKEAAQSAFQRMGMTMSGGIKLFLRQVASEQKLPFEVTAKALAKKTKMPKAVQPEIKTAAVKAPVVPAPKANQSSSNNFKKWNLFDKQQIG